MHHLCIEIICKHTIIKLSNFSLTEFIVHVSSFYEYLGTVFGPAYTIKVAIGEDSGVDFVGQGNSCFGTAKSNSDFEV